MREDKLSIQSMDFDVDIINLVKELKSKRKSIREKAELLMETLNYM